MRQLLPSLAGTKGEIGVIDNGRLVGTIDSDDIVAAIARYQAG